MHTQWLRNGEYVDFTYVTIVAYVVSIMSTCICAAVRKRYTSIASILLLYILMHIPY